MFLFSTRLALVLAAIVGILLGVHGIYVYFGGFGPGEGKDPGDLFLAIDLPDQFYSVVLWATLQGVKGWVVPALVLVGGLAVGWTGIVYFGRER